MSAAPPVADQDYLGLFAPTVPGGRAPMLQTASIGPDGVTLSIWAYPHPKHTAAMMMRPGYWQPLERLIRVGDVVLVQARHGTGEQHTAFLVRHKGAPGTVVMAEMDARFAFGGRRAA